MPKTRTLNSYGTYDSNIQDGLMEQTLKEMGDALEKKSNAGYTPEEDIWKRSGILKWDKMKVKEKIVYNPRTHEIVGFVEGAVEEDVILKSFNDFINSGETNENEDVKSIDKRPAVAQHILVFMFVLWDSKGDDSKQIVACYSVAKSNDEDLVRKILNIIAGLGKRGFIVNQVASDGASENISALKQLGTITAEMEFPDLTKKGILPKNLPVAFLHPLIPTQKIYL